MYLQTQTIVVPGLATVRIDPRDNGLPLVEIVLSDDYEGDLNDLEARNGLPAKVFFRGDRTSSINDPDLARFMEVLHHWDYDFDGAFDGDAVIDRIEEVLWQHRGSTEVFRRPSGGFYTNALMWLMPPPPERHIVFGYGDLKLRFKRWHYLLTGLTLLTILALVHLQIAAVPALRHSVLSGWGLFVDRVGFLPAWLILVAVLILRRIYRKQSESNHNSLSKHTYGFFSRAAVYEEQAFREGAENWSWIQRATSCFAFGAIHMVNLFYPLATILPLALGGALFMAVYLRTYKQTRFRRSAVLAAGVVHRVYNRLALTVVVIVVIGSLGSVVLGGLTLALALLVLRAGMMILACVRRPHQLQEAALGQP